MKLDTHTQKEYLFDHLNLNRKEPCETSKRKSKLKKKREKEKNSFSLHFKVNSRSI